MTFRIDFSPSTEVAPALLVLGSACPQCDAMHIAGAIVERLPGPIRRIPRYGPAGRKTQVMYYTCDRGHRWSEVIARH